MTTPDAEWDATAAVKLICAECGTESPPDAADWRAYLDVDGVAVMFCPGCAGREFGEG